MDFVDAGDLTQALAVLAERGSETTVLAGGTDVMVQYLRGDMRPATLLHVRRVSELSGIETGDLTTTLGATTTHWQLRTDERVGRAHPALAEAAATVGGRQTQNVGTVAGNVVNASPAADLLPPLLIADATVRLANSSGSRIVPLADFVVGRRETTRAPDELVTHVTLERIGERTGEVYLKIGRRHAMEVAVVGLAARLKFDGDGQVEDARLAVCSVAPVPFRATEAERALVGSDCRDGALREAAELLRRAAAPIDDARATAAYRTRVLTPLLERAVAGCRARAGH